MTFYDVHLDVVMALAPSEPISIQIDPPGTPTDWARAAEDDLHFRTGPGERVRWLDPPDNWVNFEHPTPTPTQEDPMLQPAPRTTDCEGAGMSPPPLRRPEVTFFEAQCGVWTAHRQHLDSYSPFPNAVPAVTTYCPGITTRTVPELPCGHDWPHDAHLRLETPVPAICPGSEES